MGRQGGFPNVAHRAVCAAGESPKGQGERTDLHGFMHHSSFAFRLIPFALVLFLFGDSSDTCTKTVEVKTKNSNSQGGSSMDLKERVSEINMIFERLRGCL